MSRSTFLGKHNGKPLMHITRSEGLSKDDMTSGLRNDTVFHSDLPYLMGDRFTINLSRGSDRRLPTGIEHGGFYEFPRVETSFKTYTAKVPSAALAAMRGNVFLLLAETTSGTIYNLPTSSYSSQFEISGGDYNNSGDWALYTTDLYRVTGGEDICYTFHPYSSPLYTGSGKSKFLTEAFDLYDFASIHPGSSFSSNSSYITLFSKHYLSKLHIIVLNIEYSYSFINYKNLVEGNNDIYLKNDTFRIGSVDLGDKVFVKDNGNSTFKYEPDTLFYSTPVYTSASSRTDADVFKHYGRWAGGLDSTEWTMDFKAGSIIAKEGEKESYLFGGDDDLDARLLYGGFSQYSYSGYKTSNGRSYGVNRVLKSLSVTPDEDGRIRGIICRLPVDKTSMVVRSSTGSANPNPGIWNPYISVANGFAASFFHLAPGESLLLSSSEAMSHFISVRYDHTSCSYINYLWLTFTGSKLEVRAYGSSGVRGRSKGGGSPTYHMARCAFEGASFHLIRLK